MDVRERKWYINELIETKKKEKEQHDAEVQKAKSKRK